MIDPRAQAEQRFWAKVQKGSAGECWHWLGRVRRYGYQNRTLAHRIAWELERGPIPAGMCVCHRCDNPPCVNPDHLFLGTHRDNMDDMNRKGRNARVGPRGELSGHAKLKESDVFDIRRRAATGERGSSIARSLGVSPQAVWDIVHGKKWKHLL